MELARMRKIDQRKGAFLIWRDRKSRPSLTAPISREVLSNGGSPLSFPTLSSS